MCLDCGCHRPNDGHGDSRHITLEDVRAAAEASGISTVDAAQRIHEETLRAIKERMAGSTSNPPFDPRLIIRVTES